MNGFELTDGFLNLPGIVEVDFCPVEGVADIPSAYSGSVTGSITLNAGYNWLKGEFVQRTSNYGGNMSRGAQGEYNTLEVQGFYPKITPSATFNFAEMQSCRYVVLAKDHNGYRRIIGSLESPAFFSFTEGSQNLGSGNQAGYNIQFNAKSALPAYFYQAELPDTEASDVTIYEPDGVTVYTTIPAGGTFTIPETMKLHRGLVSAGSTYYEHADLVGRGTTNNPTEMDIFLGSLYADWAHPASGSNSITAYNPTTGRVTFKAAIPSPTMLKAIIKTL